MLKQLPLKLRQLPSRLSRRRRSAAEPPPAEERAGGEEAVGTVEGLAAEATTRGMPRLKSDKL